MHTPTNAQTITLAGGYLNQVGVGSGSTAGSASSDRDSLVNCSVFNFASSGTKGIRLFYIQNVSGTVSNSLMLMAGTEFAPRFTVRRG